MQTDQLPAQTSTWRASTHCANPSCRRCRPARPITARSTAARAATTRARSRAPGAALSSLTLVRTHTKGKRACEWPRRDRATAVKPNAAVCTHSPPPRCAGAHARCVRADKTLAATTWASSISPAAAPRSSSERSGAASGTSASSIQPLTRRNLLPDPSQPAVLQPLLLPALTGKPGTWRRLARIAALLDELSSLGFVLAVLSLDSR